MMDWGTVRYARLMMLSCDVWSMHRGVLADAGSGVGWNASLALTVYENALVGREYLSDFAERRWACCWCLYDWSRSDGVHTKSRDLLTRCLDTFSDAIIY